MPYQGENSGSGHFLSWVFGADQAFLFDLSEDEAVIAGVRTKLQITHFKRSHRRASLAAVIPWDALFDAHNLAFAVFGGIPRRWVYTK